MANGSMLALLHPPTRVADADFPFGTVNPQLKAVALALDADGRGVEGVGVEIAKPDASFALSRATVAGGFSEDLTAPIVFLDPNKRFPVIGQWTVALANPAQFALLNDLQLFFIYQFGQADDGRLGHRGRGAR